MNKPTDPTAIEPPDDSGSEAFSRFVYQAEIAIPICVNCALGGKTLSVVTEHIEDVAIEEENHWRFVQIKTRDPELGPWRLAHLLVEGGGLLSLLRSHRALADVECSLELFLEGAIARGDLIEELTKPVPGRSPELYERIAERLDLSPENCREFLTRVRVVPNQPSRGSIRDRNIRVLAAYAPQLSVPQLQGIHDRILGEVINAMRKDRLGDQWPRCIVEASSTSTSLEAIVESKRLSRDRLKVLVPELSQELTPLLRRIVPSDGGPVSDLVLKLVAGGATEEIIQDAISLRANATAHYYADRAADLLGDERVVEDVRERLRIHANALVAKHQGHHTPAISIWNELLLIVPAQVSSIDRRGLFKGDAFLLIGEICELSDQCIIEWGRASA